MQAQEADTSDEIRAHEQANRCMSRGEFHLASDFLESILETSPNDVQALTNAAIAQWQLGNMPESISRLLHAHDIAPENSDIRISLLNALLAQYNVAQQEKDEATSLSAMRNLIAVDPECLPALTNIENALVNTGEHAVLSDYAPGLEPADLARTVLVACMPKSGSSWLLQALIGITGFEQGTFAQAYVENEQELFLPAIRHLAKKDKIVQQHCRASAPNLHYIQAFDMKTVVLVRNLFDTLVSLRDFWDRGAVRSSYFYGSWHDFDEEAKLETLAAHVAPWYVQFYASWKMAELKGEVLPHWVTYENMIPEKANTLTGVLDFAGLTAKPGSVGTLVESLEAKRRETRFNKGISGRGDAAFSDAQKNSIRNLTAAFPKIDFSPIGL